MPSYLESKRLSLLLAELDQLTDWERRPRGSMRVDLEPMLDLARRLGDPHLNFRSVHVAGTKGKGSTCALIEAGLAHAGLSVGRYASPHVVHITERVSLNGRAIDEKRLADALSVALAVFKDAKREETCGRNATWFDLLTVSAFHIFSLERVAWAVIEAGLGGRLDSTNVLPSDVAVITNVDLEHTEVLGKTRAAIAFEKAGIVKRGATVTTLLSEADDAGSVISLRAAELGCVVIRPTAPAQATIQQLNVALAAAVLDALGANGVMSKGDGRSSRPVGGSFLDPSTIEAARLPGRLETLAVTVRGHIHDTKVNVVLDGAHVPFNLAAVLTDLTRQSQYCAPCFAVVAIAEDKDAAGLLSTMKQHDVSIIFTTVGARSHSPFQLKAIADTLGLQSLVILDPCQAYEQAVRNAAHSDAWVLVTGSLYLIGVIHAAMLAGTLSAADLIARS